MKSNQMKWMLLSAVFLLILVAIYFSIHGINKTVEKTIPLEVYEDHNGTLGKDTSVTIKGNFRKTWFSSSFVGTFAIEPYEPSCREGAEAKIEWHDDYQTIRYYYAGNSFAPDLQIDIDEGMQSMRIVLDDETILKSPDYCLPAETGNQTADTP